MSRLILALVLAGCAHTGFDYDEPEGTAPQTAVPFDALSEWMLGR